MPYWANAIRWIHILAATAWFGEVVTINLVLVPALSRMDKDDSARFLARVFPRIFRLASWLSATAVITGAILWTNRFWGQWDALKTTSGMAFTAGATLATLLTLFHFFLEPRLGEMICVAEEDPDGELVGKIKKALRLIPRAGLGVITLIVLLMMVGGRGW
jgi:uncharacterized membrane protein